MARANKYNVAAPEDRTWNGRTYASKLEMTFAQFAWKMIEGGRFGEVVEQPKTLLGPGRDFSYTPDFLIIDEITDETRVGGMGDSYYVDCKGVRTQRFNEAARMWKKYGRLPLHIVVRAGNTFGWKTEEVIDCDS